MRLRKVALTTQEGVDNISKISLFKPTRRLKTQNGEANSRWVQTQKVLNSSSNNSVRHKITRFSGQFQSVDEKVEKKEKTLEQILNWIKVYGTSDKDEQELQKKHENNMKFHLEFVMKRHQKTSKPLKIHKKAITQSSFTLSSRRKKRKRTDEIPMQRQQYTKCCSIIDQIYSKLQILKQLGYTDSKIDGWFLHFCNTKQQFLKHVFMRSINFTKNTFHEQYVHQKQPKTVKNKIRNKVRKNKQTYDYVQIKQLQEISRYIEDILIHKNNTKIRQIESSITQKINTEMIPKITNNSFVFNKKQPTEVFNFVDQLQFYEDRFGPFESFSKINKLRFTQLNKVENKIKDVYNLTVKERKKNIVTADHRIHTQQPQPHDTSYFC